MRATAFIRGTLYTGMAVSALLLSGCSEPGLTQPEPLLAAAAASEPADLSGSWAWSETTVIKARAFIVPILFGIQPEGPVTHVTCATTGTMHLDQAGTTFTGSAQQSASCVTNGGQAVPAPFPPLLQVVDGQITGGSFRFTFHAGIPCPYQGAIISRHGTAIRLQGSGDCQIPDERAIGHEFVRRFTATRIG
jgi:hypothetical protein